MGEKRINSGDCDYLCRLYLIGAGVENKELARRRREHLSEPAKWLVEGASLGARGERFIMSATGELIRLINYVDDINTTLRRIQASLYGMEADERKKLADALRNADSKLRELLEQVEK